MKCQLPGFFNTFLLILIAMFGLVNPVFSMPACSSVSLDDMYAQLQQGMSLNQVTTLFGVSGYESRQDQSGLVSYV